MPNEALDYRKSDRRTLASSSLNEWKWPLLLSLCITSAVMTLSLRDAFWEKWHAQPASKDELSASWAASTKFDWRACSMHNPMNDLAGKAIITRGDLRDVELWQQLCVESLGPPRRSQSEVVRARLNALKELL